MWRGRPAIFWSIRAGGRRRETFITRCTFRRSSGRHTMELGLTDSGGSVGFLDLGGSRRTCTPLELNTWRTWRVCIGLADLQDWGGSTGLAHLADLGVGLRT